MACMSALAWVIFQLRVAILQLVTVDYEAKNISKIYDVLGRKKLNILK